MEFLKKLEDIKYKYKEEIEKLNKLCHEFIQRSLFLLGEQSNLRPILDQEKELKIGKNFQKLLLLFI